MFYVKYFGNLSDFFEYFQGHPIIRAGDVRGSSGGHFSGGHNQERWGSGGGGYHPTGGRQGYNQQQSTNYCLILISGFQV